MGADKISADSVCKHHSGRPSDSICSCFEKASITVQEGHALCTRDNQSWAVYRQSTNLWTDRCSDRLFSYCSILPTTTDDAVCRYLEGNIGIRARQQPIELSTTFFRSHVFCSHSWTAGTSLYQHVYDYDSCDQECRSRWDMNMIITSNVSLTPRLLGLSDKKWVFYAQEFYLLGRGDVQHAVLLCTSVVTRSGW